MGKEAQCPQPVVDGDQDYTALCPLVAIHRYLVAIAVLVGASVNPQGYGEVLAPHRSPYVQVQAVFSLLRSSLPIKLISVEGSGRISRLRSDGAEGIANPYAFPGLGRLGRPPAQLPYRRRRIRDALIDHNFRIFGRKALNFASCHRQHRQLRSTGQQRHGCGKDD